MTGLDETRAGALTSWVESAQSPGCDFPIQNLPFGVFRRAGSAEAARVGIAIGDRILDLSAAARDGWLGDNAEIHAACARSRLNALMALGPEAWRAVRISASRLLRSDSAAFARDRTLGDRLLVPMRDAELFLPADIGDYTDFYAAIAHATNVGSMFRPDNPLLPNYKWVPIGYHGRASSIVVSGTPVRRPVGQTHDAPDAPPTVGPSGRLDYELEVGVFVGTGNALGDRIAVDDAERHVFGLCLVNDWSARDVQTWEYQPLGPFLAKNFATTLSPWVVTLDALEPYRSPAYARPDGDPAPLPYLASPANARRGGVDVTLEVLIASERMRARSMPPLLVSRGSFNEMYWTIAQLLAHHTVNGCNLRAGDLLASGTVSGQAKETRGCLLERTWRGTEPLQLPTGESRKFLEDGDEVILRGYCERAGFARIGFGECRGTVQPATG
jgi:fumarylacetoacetase